MAGRFVMSSQPLPEIPVALSPGLARVPLVRARTLLAGLLSIDVAVLLAHLLIAEHKVLGGLFDLDKEANLPTWTSSTKFALAAAAAVFCYFAETTGSDAERPRLSSAWLLVAVFMLALSADESSQVHETLTDWLMAGPAGANFRSAFGATEASDSMLWVVVFSPLMILAATALVLFYLHRFKSSRRLIGGALAAVLLLAAAAFLETREAAIAGAEGFLSAERWRTYLWYVGLEEMAEQVAVSLLVAVHYAYAARRFALRPAVAAGSDPPTREQT